MLLWSKRKKHECGCSLEVSSWGCVPHLPFYPDEETQAQNGHSVVVGLLPILFPGCLITRVDLGLGQAHDKSLLLNFPKVQNP